MKSTSRCKVIVRRIRTTREIGTGRRIEKGTLEVGDPGWTVCHGAHRYGLLLLGDITQGTTGHARIISCLKDGGFLEAFRRKGRFAGLMAGMPVHVILNPKAALMGAAWYGLDRA